MRSLKIFEDWTLCSLEKLLYVVDMITIPKDEYIITQGNEANGFYIIFKGEALIKHKIVSSYKEKLNFSNQTHTNEDNNEEFSNSINEICDDKELSFRDNKYINFRQHFHNLINKSK